MLGKGESKLQEILAVTEPSVKAILEAAVKIEEQSYALYAMAQEKVKYPSSKKFIEELAQEELKHKNRLEREYDDYVLREG